MSTLTYVFCLVRSDKRPSVRMRAPLPGASPLRAIPIEPSSPRRRSDLWLMAASVPDAEYGEAALASRFQDLDWVAARAMAHEATIERFLSASAVLPMKLFTIFMTDERATAHVVRERQRIGRILARIRGQHEWGVRFTWDARAVRQASPPRSGRIDGKRGGGSRRAKSLATTGAAYLAGKRDLLSLDRAQLARARTEVNRLYRILSRAASGSRRRAAMERAGAGTGLLLDAAFLVPAAHGARFRAALRRSAKTLEQRGVTVSVTGPWPPYNFV